MPAIDIKKDVNCSVLNILVLVEFSLQHSNRDGLKCSHAFSSAPHTKDRDPLLRNETRPIASSNHAETVIDSTITSDSSGMLR